MVFLFPMHFCELDYMLSSVRVDHTNFTSCLRFEFLSVSAVNAGIAMRSVHQNRGSAEKMTPHLVPGSCRIS